MVLVADISAKRKNKRKWSLEGGSKSKNNVKGFGRASETHVWGGFRSTLVLIEWSYVCGGIV